MAFIVLALLMASCGAPYAGQPYADPDAEGVEEPEGEATEAPAESDTETDGEPVTIRWFVGLGAGTRPEQLEAQEAFVEEYNSNHEDIQIELEIVQVQTAKDVLSTEIASGNPPDIVGPVGVAGSNAFNGLYLDLTPYIEATNYDLSQFDEEAVNFYNVEGEGQIGLPFGVYPAFIFYNRDLFDEAGLNYPPHQANAMYEMPDGSEREWNIETLREIAMLLTIDQNGLNATEEGFDPDNIVQFGFQGQWLDLRGMATLFGAGSFDDGTGQAQIPDEWRTAWEWYYDGIWTDYFIPNSAYSQSEQFGQGNEFNSGRVAMAHTHLWYTCCIDGVENWDIAINPSHNGEIVSNMHVDTFRILKDTEHPEEAFEVLTYLIGPGSQELLALYGSMPARTADQDAFFADLDEKYPQGVDWQVVRDSLRYPDIPSHEGYMPNYQKAYDRATAFQSLLYSTADLDIEAELETLQADLQAIFEE